MTSHLVDSHLAHIASLEQQFGATSAQVATALSTLAGLICKYEDPPDSVPYFRRCLEIRETLYGSAGILDDLNGWIDQRNIDFPVQEPFVLKRIEVKTALFGEVDLRVAEDCDQLASTYSHLRRFATARPLLERSLAIRERINGPSSPDVAAILERLVEVCLQVGDLTAADQYFERCAAVTEYALGASSKELAQRLVLLSAAYVVAGKSQRDSIKRDLIRRALSVYGKGLSITDETFGPDSFAVQKALETMAHACLECNEFHEAEPLLKRLLAISERVYGNDAAALLWILIELALGYALAGSDKAEAFVDRSFRVLKALLECKRPTCRHKIANFPGKGDVLFSSGNPGLLEKLLRATEIDRSNARRRWGA